MEVPLKDSIKYPCQVNTKTTKDTQKLLLRLKQMGVDVGELQRRAIDSAARIALESLDKSAS